MVRQLGLIAWLTLLWLVLWGDFTMANTVSGLSAAVLITSIFPGTPGDPPRHTVRPHLLVAFLLYFHWKLLEANFVLAREVLTPTDHSSPGIIAIPVQQSSQLVITLIANAITLTPGTVTLEVTTDPAVLYVHVLHLRDPERVRRDVRRLERLALRAMGVEDTLTDHGNVYPDTPNSDLEAR